MGFFSKLGDTLRNTFLNPIKDTLATTPLGMVANTLVPGVLDSRVNIFADPPPAPVALRAATVPPPSAAPGAGGVVTIRRDFLQALVAEARQASTLRSQVATLSNQVRAAAAPRVAAPLSLAARIGSTPAPIFSVSNFLRSRRSVTAG